MKTMSKKDKQDWALMLYQHGHDQKTIAQKVGASQNTIKAWKEKFGWEAQKASLIMSKDQELLRVYSQINELNNAIANKEPGERYASSKEADALSKLTGAAKSLEGELGLSDVVNVSKAFLDYLKPIDFEAGELLSKYMDSYIRDLLSK